ncbi:hypothetical protein [Corynebacterium sp. A21]
MSAEPDFSGLNFLTPLAGAEDAPVCGPAGCFPSVSESNTTDNPVSEE